MNELQKTMLNMFKEFVKVCDKHNLTYYLAAGTTLGAIRHKGFIPWDDDLDIAMPRKDFEKLLKLKDEFKDPFFLQHYSTDPGFVLPYMKLRNSNTTFLETTWQYHNINHGVWIDIFVLDGMSRTEKLTNPAKYYFLWIPFYFAFMGHFWNKPTKRRFYIQIPLYLVSIILLPLNIFNWLIKAVTRSMKRIPYEEGKLVGSFLTWGGNKEALPIEIYGEGVMVPFEDMMARVPSDSHNYLKRRFGDYMTPPPPEKQVGGHTAVVIDTTVSYKQYTKNKTRK